VISGLAKLGPRNSYVRRQRQQRWCKACINDHISTCGPANYFISLSVRPISIRSCCAIYPVLRYTPHLRGRHQGRWAFPTGPPMSKPLRTLFTLSRPSFRTRACTRAFASTRVRSSILKQYGKVNVQPVRFKHDPKRYGEDSIVALTHNAHRD